MQEGHRASGKFPTRNRSEMWRHDEEGGKAHTLALMNVRQLSNHLILLSEGMSDYFSYVIRRNVYANTLCKYFWFV